MLKIIQLFTADEELSTKQICNELNAGGVLPAGATVIDVTDDWEKLAEFHHRHSDGRDD